MSDQIIDKALNYIGEKLPNINVVTAYARVSKAVSATTATTVNTVTLTTGRWLVLSYMSLSASGSNSYNHYLAGRTVRSTPHNGGGSVNFAYMNVTGASSDIVVQAYTPMACTVHNEIVAIKLGGGVKLIVSSLVLMWHRWLHEQSDNRQGSLLSWHNTGAKTDSKRKLYIWHGKHLDEIGKYNDSQKWVVQNKGELFKFRSEWNCIWRDIKHKRKRHHCTSGKHARRVNRQCILYPVWNLVILDKVRDCIKSKHNSSLECTHNAIALPERGCAYV